jgi:hypothetical protein
MASGITTTTSSTKNHRNLETFSLVWLDNTINNSQENLNTLKRLRTIINHLLTFEDSKTCEEYICSVSNHDRIVIIVSGISGRQLVPRIHELEQVCSIYVYCMDRKTNEQWTKNFPKVKITNDNFNIHLVFFFLRFELLLLNLKI